MIVLMMKYVILLVFMEDSLGHEAKLPYQQITSTWKISMLTQQVQFSKLSLKHFVWKLRNTSMEIYLMEIDAVKILTAMEEDVILLDFARA